MGRGPGCRAATAIEGSEWLNAGTWCRRPAVKYGSYPGGAVMTAGRERRVGGRLRRWWGRGLSYDISKSQCWGIGGGGNNMKWKKGKVKKERGTLSGSQFSVH